MYQTGTRGVQPFSYGIPYDGGICRWWYIPWDEVEGWPAVNRLTQLLDGTIIVSTPWFGPILVPDDERGISERPKRTTAGLYYDQKVFGFYPGDSVDSRINIENSHHYEWIIVAKMRAGGMYLVFGSEAVGVELNQDYESKGDETAGGDFAFSFQSLNKAMILTTFDETNVTSPPGYTPAPVNPTQPQGDMEEITYTNEQQVNIEWTPARLQRFGDMPVIQVFYTDPDDGVMMNPTPIIRLNALPPAMTQITVKINAPGPGLITISR